MLGRIPLRFWGQAAVLLALAACNRPDLVDPTSTQTPLPLSLEEIETAVVATLLAEGEATAAARQSATPVPTVPTATPSDTPVGPTETPTEIPSCIVVSNFLNLRFGPGLVYDPPLKTLSSGTVLLPFARNADGSWLEVSLVDSLDTGWVSAAGQFVECNREPLSFPLGVIPATPIPTNTPTPTLT
ncbi:MAG: hypothetical protein ACE5JF_07375, partial [Anaerolineales bacterium]